MLISFAGWQVRKDIALEFTDGMSGILGPWCTYCRACCPLLGFYTLTSVAVARVYGRVYINVPECVFFSNWMFDAFARWCYSSGVPCSRVHIGVLVYPWCPCSALKSQRNQFAARLRATKPAPQFPLLWPPCTTWAQLDWTRRGLGEPSHQKGGPRAPTLGPLWQLPSAVTTGRWPHDPRGPQTSLRARTSRGWWVWSAWRCWTWQFTSTQWPSPPTPCTWLWQAFTRWMGNPLHFWDFDLGKII